MYTEDAHRVLQANGVITCTYTIVFFRIKESLKFQKICRRNRPREGIAIHPAFLIVLMGKWAANRVLHPDSQTEEAFQWVMNRLCPI